MLVSLTIDCLVSITNWGPTEPSNEVVEPGKDLPLVGHRDSETWQPASMPGRLILVSHRFPSSNDRKLQPAAVMDETWITTPSDQQHHHAAGLAQAAAGRSKAGE